MTSSVKMEQDTDDQKFFVLEWTVKNFSCWNSEIHEKMITSQKSPTTPQFWMELFPRGLSGKHESLVVRLHSSVPWTFPGGVSFVGSDEWTISTQQVKSEENIKVLELPPGPKFAEVVSKIRKSEDLHEDKFTVRYSFRNEFNYKYNCFTKIDVHHMSLKISPNQLNKIRDTLTCISVFNIPVDEGIPDSSLVLYARKNETIPSKIELAFKMPLSSKNTAIIIRTTVLNSGRVLRSEEKDHVLPEDNAWYFFKSQPGEVDKRFSFILQMKIIPFKRYINSLGSPQKYPKDTTPKFSRILTSPIEADLMDTNVITGSSDKPQKSCISPFPTGFTDGHINPASSEETQIALIELSKELMCLYQDQDFSDFTLKCGDVTFPVHKAILSARSPVFKTMLSCDMREAASSEVVITDLDPSTLARFLTFLYTGALEEDLQEESALNLYYAADKYQVSTLKKKCIDFLCNNVSVSNVCDILSLANRHQDDRLIEMAKDFFLKHFSEVLASDEWKMFMKEEPSLAVETLTDVGMKKSAGKMGSI